jgi:hypothetical protein
LLPAVFIRAPYVVSVGPEVDMLATVRHRGVAVGESAGLGESAGEAESVGRRGRRGRESQWGVARAGAPGECAGLVLPSRADARPEGAPVVR